LELIIFHRYENGSPLLSLSSSHAYAEATT